MVKVSRVIEAKNISHVYYGWHNELQLTVEGGELKIQVDESSLRAIAQVVNNKIAEQDKEKVEAAAELAEKDSELE